MPRDENPPAVSHGWEPYNCRGGNCKPYCKRFGGVSIVRRLPYITSQRTSGAVVNMKPHVVSLSANWYAASPNITCLPVVAPLVLHETRWLSSLDRFSPRTIVATPSVSCTTATPVSRHRERYSSRRSRKNRAAARRNVADLTMPRHSACHVSGRPRPERPDRTDGPAPQGATGRTDRRKRGSGQTPDATKALLASPLSAELAKAIDLLFMSGQRTRRCS